MGTLRSAIDHTGNEFNGVTLGAPVPLLKGEPCPEGQTPDEYLWDDARLPSATVDSLGAITLPPVPGEVIVKGTPKARIALALSPVDALSRAESFGIAVQRPVVTLEIL